MLQKIVSGGQTGVDRGALDAALEMRFPCGGWCPRDRKAEDGRIPARYPLTETESPQYLLRTEQNVIDSDATVIFYFHVMEGGTGKTQAFCQQHNKPCMSIDLGALENAQATAQLQDYLTTQEIQTLNVAGPRASKQPQAQQRVKEVIHRLLSTCGQFAGDLSPSRLAVKEQNGT